MSTDSFCLAKEKGWFWWLLLTILAHYVLFGTKLLKFRIFLACRNDILSCFLYFNQGRQSCPGTSCLFISLKIHQWSICLQALPERWPRRQVRPLASRTRRRPWLLQKWRTWKTITHKAWCTTPQTAQKTTQKVKKGSAQIAAWKGKWKVSHKME